MGHGRRKHPLIKHIRRYFPVAVAFLGLGILLAVILPVWIWVLTASIVIIVIGFNNLYK
ncbi:hypothetical protein [Fonticella tunisiensis]|uniref:Uncharacterized protein n=1 Tax=Fonticella tunisiensis TaxID=1096341 RepID=A0A4R7KQX7_9CLOT|nr:hypothetical protein [Fonticella tunisiensis]TDT61630.1 hypothetical protein EDD71_106114 [Fonticella tunisiensis]